MPVRTYADFKERHPDYLPELWKRYRAFYAGGRKLLEDEELMDEVFPKHLREEADVYKERKRRAFYIPYAGQVVDSIVAALTYRPITVAPYKDGSEPDEDGKREENPDEFYQEFYDNCAAPGSVPMSVNQLARVQIQESLQIGRSWTLVDLPAAPERTEEDPPTVAQAEAEGLRAAYAVPVPAECVVNWEEDKSGQLVAVLIRDEERKWAGLGSTRDTVKEIYTYYDETSWERWSITHKVDVEPKDEDPMTFEGGGDHSFGRVPVTRLNLPDGLHAMGKIESIAREHFNKRNAVSWSQLKNLLPIMYGKVARGPLDPDGAEGTVNLLNQPYGPGRMLVIGAEDEIGYAAPDAGVYESALADLSNLRDEMHRVLHAMAQSVDNSGAALQRSGESKSEDKEAMNVVLRHLGMFVRDHVKDVHVLVHAGRADDQATDWDICGMDEFTDTSVTELVEQALSVETVTIPSQTFQVAYKVKVSKALLGKDTNQQILDRIKKELEENIKPEQFDQPTPREQFDAEQDAAAAKQMPPGAKK